MVISNRASSASTAPYDIYIHIFLSMFANLHERQEVGPFMMYQIFVSRSRIFDPSMDCMATTYLSMDGMLGVSLLSFSFVLFKSRSIFLIPLDLKTENTWGLP